MNTKPMPRHTLISESLFKRVEQDSYLLVWKGDETQYHSYKGKIYEVIEARHIIETVVTFFGIFKFRYLEQDHAGILFRYGDDLAHGVDWGLGLDDSFGERLVFETSTPLALDTPVKLYGGF